MHTKRILVTALLVLAAAFRSGAQQPDILQQLQDHPEYLDATDYLCPTGPVALTKAPKGYTPFYVSHYGRHGARYAWQSDLYDMLNKVFSDAAAQGNLTDLGKSYKERFDLLYPSVRYRTGDLSRKGWQQQQELASRMYDNFPEVFKNDARVTARTSTSTRCVMTMSSFCLGLKGRNPKLDIFENFGYSFLPAILPLDSHNPFREKSFRQTPLSFSETWEQYIERTVDYRAILARLFPDVEKAVPEKEQWDFASYLYFFAAGMASLDTDLSFTDIFTPEERVALWKIDDFQFYANAWPTHLGYRPIVDDIIACADERIASGEKGADLRFGHDYTFLPLLMTLDVDGFGHDVTNPDDIPVWCQLNRVPMGANLHFVFYRSKKAGQKTLFKVLLNGQEAHLPIETDNWPYYDWEAFKKHFYKPVMGEVSTIQTTVPEVSGLCPAPAGDGFLAASDEKGVYHVSWTGETTEFYVERRLDCEGVTMDPATRDVYFIVEGKQEVRRLRAPDYKESEVVFTLQEGRRTNLGLEGITWYKDGTLLIGNQMNPVLLVQVSPTDGEIARHVITGTSEVADLCYDPVRDVLWIADSERHILYLCTPEGEVKEEYPMPDIDNGEAVYVDHANSCIWLGDDTTSQIYRISFKNL